MSLEGRDGHVASQFILDLYNFLKNLSKILQHIFTSYIAISHITDLSSSSSTFPIICGHFYSLERPAISKVIIPKSKFRSSPRASSSSSSSDINKHLVTQAQNLEGGLDSSSAPLLSNQGSGSIFLDYLLHLPLSPYFYCYELHLGPDGTILHDCRGMPWRRLPLPALAHPTPSCPD